MNFFLGITLGVFMAWSGITPEICVVGALALILYLETK